MFLATYLDHKFAVLTLADAKAIVQAVIAEVNGWPDDDWECWGWWREGSEYIFGVIDFRIPIASIKVVL